MEILWDKFINIMSQILEDYRQLLKLGKEKQKILVAADVEGLINITKQEELIVLKINKLEWQRKAAVKEIAEAHKLKGNYQADEFIQSIFEIKKLADAKEAERLNLLAEELTAGINELTALNRLNSQLIEQSLEFINFNINILSAASFGPTYSPGTNTSDSEESQIKRRNILNAQA